MGIEDRLIISRVYVMPVDSIYVKTLNKNRLRQQQILQNIWGVFGLNDMRLKEILILLAHRKQFDFIFTDHELKGYNWHLVKVLLH